MQPLRRSYNIKQQKEIDSTRIAVDVEKFLAKGGLITQIPTGLSGDDALNQKSVLALSNNQARADNKRGLVGGAAVARMAGMSYTRLIGLCDRGEGPSYVQNGNRRMFERAVIEVWLETRKSLIPAS